MANIIQIPKNWSCDGKELKPKSGAKNSDTWILDGRELKLKYGASFSNTWIWDGKEIRPKTGGSYANTWVIEGQKVKPKINGPPIAEQARIIAEVDRHLSIIREVEAEVDANLLRAQALRQATLRAAFAGSS